MHVLYFGSGAVEGIRRIKSITGVLKNAAAIGALVVDARTPNDFVRSLELLRALYDDPRRPERVVHPHRVLAVIDDGDVEAAFAFGRFGISGVLEDRELDELPSRVTRALRTEADVPLPVPVLAPHRPTRLAPRAETDPPIVAIGYRHAPETLDALERYVRTLRAHAHESTVFEDAAALIEVMVRDGLTCRTNLATKAGATHGGQFIGSYEFYRELRRTRYAKIPDHPAGAIAMDAFISVDEVVHEVLHLLFLANEVRAGIAATSTLFAEELSLTWWQAVVHHRVFPEWLCDRHILEINDDFLLAEQNEEPRGFWNVGTVFDRYAAYPWIPYVISHLPERSSYIGERADLTRLVEAYAGDPSARFLAADPARLRIAVPFEAYPPIPPALRVGGEVSGITPVAEHDVQKRAPGASGQFPAIRAGGE
jgi:hypothetical protein